MQETAYFLLGVHFGWKRNKFSLGIVAVVLLKLYFGIDAVGYTYEERGTGPLGSRSDPLCGNC